MSHDMSKDQDRLYKLTNFTGSNGLAIVFQNRKPIFMTDNRYKLQSQQEINPDEFEIMDPSLSTEISEILTENKSSDQPYASVYIDGSLFPLSFTERIKKQLLKSGIKFEINIKEPLVDQVLQQHPDNQANQSNQPKIHGFELKNPGLTFEEKRMLALNHQISKKMGLDSIYVSSPEEVSWFLNMRATGINEYSPIINGFMVISKNHKTYLFVDKQSKQALEQTRLRLEGDIIEICDLGQFKDRITNLGLESIGIDRRSCSSGAYEVLNQSGIKSIKFFEESAALISFYAKLNAKLNADEKIHEHDCPQILDEIRQQLAGSSYLSNSFPMICGSGGNGAIIHYRAQDNHSRLLNKDESVLIDTGAQYIQGTTDTTRTLLFSNKKSSKYDNIREMYTRVLLGNLSLEKTQIPKGTYGYQIESIGRRHLWEVEKDFSHGIGHGVSHCGPVHEYPHYAYGKDKNSALALQENMIITNEPGYYLENQYGIRIENMLLIEKCENNHEFLKFKSLTLVPYSKNLIDMQLLDQSHKFWIKGYYSQILHEIEPILKRNNKLEALDYLHKETKEFI
ncbi:x-pro aminopeptidase [Stylonychia lemnae]|uniref:X-pro aminopeptidase n=1 Tax=Stylonychia lemnae TaxID=5949 RepID=A0A077ZZI2_STYLE|nr:x-pro aminopeptidase [Stylonychia lemnae]|eukprot:CDW73923.1 x-pro aminopeptidase [Stylonychia lemnae]